MLVHVLNGNKDLFVRVIPSRLKTFVLTLSKIFAILRCIPVRPLKQCLSILEEDLSLQEPLAILYSEVILLYIQGIIQIFVFVTLITLWVVSLIIQFQLCHISLYHIILINVLSTKLQCSNVLSNVTEGIYHVLERVKKDGEQHSGKNFLDGQQQQQEL